MEARMKNPILIVPDALQAAMALGEAAKKGDVPVRMLTLLHLRASQINGCGFCVDMHARELKKLGDKDERIFAVSAWQGSPYFTDAEQAALALTEAATRMNDRADPVPDEIWAEAAKHFHEEALASIVLNIAMINFWNRLNVTVGQMAGSWPQ